MGLFDKMLGGSASDRPFTKQEAFAAILVATVASDGHISDEEARGFNAIINRVQLYREMNGDQFSSMVDKLLGIVRRDGSVRLMEKAAAALPTELRETAFALAVDLVLADGSVEAEEKVLLEAVQLSLQVPDDLALKVIEVLMIKNRG